MRVRTAHEGRDARLVRLEGESQRLEVFEWEEVRLVDAAALSGSRDQPAQLRPPRLALRGHARRLDQAHSAPGTTPVEDRLRWFGDTRGLVYGQYGEASRDVHDLLTAVATRAADGLWRGMGCRSQAEALSFLTSHYRRRWGMLVVREYARHRIRRVPYIGLARGARAVGSLGAGAGAAPLAAALEAQRGVRAQGAWAG